MFFTLWPLVLSLFTLSDIIELYDAFPVVFSFIPILIVVGLNLPNWLGLRVIWFKDISLLINHVLTPSAPWTPIGPWNPIAPWIPIGPLFPSGPWSPGNPEGPAGPPPESAIWSKLKFNFSIFLEVVPGGLKSLICCE